MMKNSMKYKGFSHLGNVVIFNGFNVVIFHTEQILYTGFAQYMQLL